MPWEAGSGECEEAAVLCIYMQEHKHEESGREEETAGTEQDTGVGSQGADKGSDTRGIGWMMLVWINGMVHSCLQRLVAVGALIFSSFVTLLGIL